MSAVLIVAIAAGVGALLLLLLFTFKCLSRKRPKTAFPPIGMLAHERERHQEDFMRRSFYVHNTDSFASLPPRRSLVSPSSSSPLIATKSAPTAEGALP